MSVFTRNRTSVLYDLFYCTGVIMALACIAFVVAGNTELLWQPEHASIPLSWVFGGVSVLSFLAAEICPLPAVDSDEAEELVRRVTIADERRIGAALFGE